MSRNQISFEFHLNRKYFLGHQTPKYCPRTPQATTIENCMKISSKIDTWVQFWISLLYLFRKICYKGFYANIFILWGGRSAPKRKRGDGEAKGRIGGENKDLLDFWKLNYFSARETYARRWPKKLHTTRASRRADSEAGLEWKGTFGREKAANWRRIKCFGG